MHWHRKPVFYKAAWRGGYVPKHGQGQISQGHDIHSIFSSHVETVALLSNGVIDSQKVRVEFSLEGLDVTPFRGKATYEQIKDYVFQQTGMKVSSLYIPQVKRKYGLEVGDSYNKTKSDDAKQPQCPPEKETAIIDALRHFGMI